VARAYLATLLPGKAHLARLPDGGLLCKDVVIARSGPLEYHASDLGLPGDGIVKVNRPPEEITRREFIASIEGCVVTDLHPMSFVNSKNFQMYARGFASNVRIGPVDARGNTTTLADLFIHDAGLADKVENGTVRDVSIGFNVDFVMDEIGRWNQINLRCNHVAVVPRGRAGSTKIVDAAAFDSEREEPVSDANNFVRACSEYLGQDVIEVAREARKEECSTARKLVFDSPKTDAEKFLEAVERMGEEMRARRR
jgi:hypothetical protein